jgi:hypothetical protein
MAGRVHSNRSHSDLTTEAIGLTENYEPCPVPWRRNVTISQNDGRSQVICHTSVATGCGPWHADR